MWISLTPLSLWQITHADSTLLIFEDRRSNSTHTLLYTVPLHFPWAMHQRQTASYRTSPQSSRGSHAPNTNSHSKPPQPHRARPRPLGRLNLRITRPAGTLASLGAAGAPAEMLLPPRLHCTPSRNSKRPRCDLTLAKIPTVEYASGHIQHTT